MTLSIAAHAHSAQCSDCVNQPMQVGTQSDKYIKLLKVVDVISALVLTVFALYVNYILFLAFFTLGLSIGIYKQINEKGVSTSSPPATTCSQGLMEQLTGIRLPRPLSTILNVGATLAHIEHHSTFFIPIVATFVGVWSGKKGVILFRRF